jgi:hypothetical protein
VCNQSRIGGGGHLGFCSFDASRVASLVQGAQGALASHSPRAARAAGGSPAGATQLHVAPGGDGLLVTTAAAAGDTGVIVLRGHIGPFPYELRLQIVAGDGTVTVTAELVKPFAAGPFQWTFELTGIVRDASSQIVGASDVVPIDTVAPPGGAAAGLNWLCVLRCGGTAILGVLVKCLPSLVGGPGAYIACVTSSAGGAAAGIAACIATKCA